MLRPRAKYASIKIVDLSCGVLKQVQHDVVIFVILNVVKNLLLYAWRLYKAKKIFVITQNDIFWRKYAAQACVVEYLCL
jgi:hypothetical protein